MDGREVLLTGDRLTLTVDCPAPITRGSVDVCLSTARGGPPVHPTLARTLLVTDGTIPPVTLFTKDVRAMFPRGGRVWLVVRYGGQLLASGEVRVVV
ncbi:MAG: hypothetical protein HEQ38_20500 [Gemmatimonas sp.]|nr:hypothetical protein [Gemmatimonas sp.]MCO4101725.1 hypothetical protein [Gemmatimonas sp.]